MSVARISGPQVLDPPLRTPQKPIDQEGVGVSGDLVAILVASPTRVLADVSPKPKIELRSEE